ncbi:MAG: alpha/beta hydrolase fold domain-containing protein [Nitrosospira sp.]|nr:alpha/beta hydrolase fold domain-containing protein [Nitrosospira sp.]
MTSTPKNLLPAIELETGIRPTHTILWMHGLGADGNDFVPIVNELALPRNPHIRFLFPHAPMRPVSINNGLVMRAWHDYDLTSSNSAFRENAASLRNSQGAIEALIDREKQRGIAPQNILLAGFSQGGALALHTGLRYPEKLAGIMALSCYLPAAQTFAAEAHQANSGISIFMAHGNLDNIVPMTLAAASNLQLQAAGYTVEWHEYAMAHAVCKDEIADIGDWLKRVLI